MRTAVLMSALLLAACGPTINLGDVIATSPDRAARGSYCSDLLVFDRGTGRVSPNTSVSLRRDDGDRCDTVWVQAPRGPDGYVVVGRPGSAERIVRRDQIAGYGIARIACQDDAYRLADARRDQRRAIAAFATARTEMEAATAGRRRSDVARATAGFIGPVRATTVDQSLPSREDQVTAEREARQRVADAQAALYAADDATRRLTQAVTPCPADVQWLLASLR